MTMILVFLLNSFLYYFIVTIPSPVLIPSAQFVTLFVMFCVVLMYIQCNLVNNSRDLWFP